MVDGARLGGRQPARHRPVLGDHGCGDAAPAQPDLTRGRLGAARAARPRTARTAAPHHRKRTQMSVRKSSRALVAAAVAGSALALSRRPASAAVDPDDTTFTPVTADLIGVGSDTSQHAIKLLADAWNASGQAPAKIATFAATGGGTDHRCPTAAINRPNGSGAGKALLYGAGNNTDIDFARSSSAQQRRRDPGRPAGLPVRPRHPGDGGLGQRAVQRPGRADAGADRRHLQGRRSPTGTQIGGTAGVIAPKIPQAGSGTRSFFDAQLQAMNGGVAVTLGAQRRRGPGARRHPDQERPQRDRAVLEGPRRRCSAPRCASRPASPPTARSTTWSAAPTSANPTIQARVRRGRLRLLDRRPRR